MDWNTEIVPGVPVTALLLAFAWPIFSFVRETVRNAWKNPKMAGVALWGYAGTVLLLSQAGSDPVTGTQMVLAIVGISSMALALRVAVGFAEQELIRNYEAERAVNREPRQ